MKPSEAAERRASAAPLAGVCRVEDSGRRQLPGNVRAAARWSAEGWGSPERSEGWGMSACKQAVAHCWVNRAQPKDAPAASAARRGSGAVLYYFFDLSEGSELFSRLIDGILILPKATPSESVGKGSNL